MQNLSINLRWDLNSFFPGPASLTEQLDVLECEAEAANAAPPESLTDLIVLTESLGARVAQMWTYLYCRQAADRRDAEAAGALVRLDATTILLDCLNRLQRERLAHLSMTDFAHLCRTPSLADAVGYLERQRQDGIHSGGDRAGNIQAEALERSMAWSRQADTVFAELTFEIAHGETRPVQVPFARRFDYLWGDDAGLRRAAWIGLQKAVEDRSETLAASLNGLARERLRRIEGSGLSPLADAAFRNGLAEATVAAALAAAREIKPVLLRYLDLKCRLLGLPAMGMQDRSAASPVWRTASLGQEAVVARVRQAFSRTAPMLGHGVDRLIKRRRVDAVGTGERASAGFCAPAPLSPDPLIFMNLDGGFYAQAVFAHELGHGVHGSLLEGARPMNRWVSSAMAETAAIAAEQLFRVGIFRDPAATPASRIEALMAELDTAVNYALRIPRDVEFEADLYREALVGPLTVPQLSAMADKAHEAWFGDALGASGDPHAWAFQPLLYDAQRTFLNMPYVVGFLLGCAIVRAFDDDAERFGPSYSRFLRAAGARSGEEAALEMGMDLTNADFWRSAAALVEQRVTQFTREAGLDGDLV